ncbi:hypothetical protein SODALDRAFT_355766 [Sodiomyces alkalinus F11]|uniref:GYF domain-containing protein n=1 Tax=Sodiomyces alkalinus (strain CBS 110278 / VKM F-3762 / F11) TaxID=1314773 RepID=A0A3N2Q9Y0_SODAK|nr:hypothetical protein SODALDRAFT_355766 [Sodiomyces alkalinus F11]ROT43552.1 hypothetical protein SODALDRAFT_355766 [Sodiomyces alkalinus F11]
MASRLSAARPKRAGENFARTHHLDDDDRDSKKAKFDIRNPSALAPDAREEDEILDADVIGTGAATKRGAVNLDGYDSDSDVETFHERAEQRSKGKGDPNILEQLDNYDATGRGANGKGGTVNEDDDEDDDMFAGEKDEGEQRTTPQEEDSLAARKKRKEVRFLEDELIQGQEMESKSGGQISLDDAESSDDEQDLALAIQEEGIDEEVGLGGLKRNAPKVEAFNMKAEQEEGRFDANGNYIRKAVDPDAVHDRWLEGVSKKEMKKAAEAHERREAEARRARMADDSLVTTDLLRTLILRLEKTETPLEALARLGKGKAKQKKVPKWKLKKQAKGAESMDVDQEQQPPQTDAEQARIKEAIDIITDAADKLLSRDHAEIYDQERELLIREWQRESGEEWSEPRQEKSEAAEDGGSAAATTMWEFRWTDGRDTAEKQGPFDTATMKAWQDAGYFGEGVEFRAAGDEGAWTRIGNFD